MLYLRREQTECVPKRRSGQMQERVEVETGNTIVFESLAIAPRREIILSSEGDRRNGTTT